MEEQEKLQASVKRFKGYGEYLERVLQCSEEFSEINDLLNRYYTLKITNNNLLDNQNEMIDLSEEQRNKNFSYYKESQHSMLKESNLLATYQKTLESEEEKALNHQDHVNTELKIVRQCYMGHFK